jgi:hypothetical protein
MTSAAGTIGLAAAVQVIACSASRHIMAGERRRACNVAQTRVPTELGRARLPCYTDLRSQITQFK